MRLTHTRMAMSAALIVLTMALAAAFPAMAFADHLDGSTAWTVKFNSDAKMVDNFPEKQWADDVGSLQPGDDITLIVNLVHENATACDWYMANEVLKSLEDGSAKGSAYKYLLTYIGPSGQERTLYDSSTVGGDVRDGQREGLTQATSALEDFFYLDNLKKNETAQIKLVVGLDGETEGNAYFDTLAQLKMKFAVELPTNNGSSDKKSGGSSAVKTGDDTNLFPFYVIMVVSGTLLAFLAIGLLRRSKNEADGV